MEENVKMTPFLVRQKIKLRRCLVVLVCTTVLVIFPKMKLLFFISFILCEIMQRTGTVAVRSSIVDVASDMTYSWKIKGNYFYSPNGLQLTEIKDKFPPGFDFNSIAQAKGVWSVFPTVDPVMVHNETLWTNKVAISFASSAQLMDSVTIWHNSGGHAIINVIVNGENNTQISESMFSGWITFGLALHGKSQFTIEAIVKKPQDYIIIDKIQANYVETTTSTHSPWSSTSSTKKPQPTSRASSKFLKTVPWEFFPILTIYAAKLLT